MFALILSYRNVILFQELFVANSPMQYCEVQYTTEQYSTVQSSTVQWSEVQYSEVQFTLDKDDWILNNAHQKK